MPKSYIIEAIFRSNSFFQCLKLSTIDISTFSFIDLHDYCFNGANNLTNLTLRSREINIGNAEIRQTFKVSNVGTIAGCYVTEGKVERNAGVRIIRDGVVIHDGKLISLKRFKDDVKEVNAGYECGLVFEGFGDLQEADQIECYKMVEVPR